jgi:alkanesulfonate monooxygenase SsuD/methylene tetrahydromethanopterin reductase-like flavin-dependent oxidoreductase (luciferase family)
MRALLDGQEVTSHPGGRYAFDHLRLAPAPVQGHLPIMIGGDGERKTLRTVAQYADMWNMMGSLERARHKLDVLHAHCEAVGRDPVQIELTFGCKPLIRDSAAEARRVWEAQMAHNRTPLSEVERDDTFWMGSAEEIAQMMVKRKELGFHTFIAELAAPYDTETIERWIGEVKPMVDAA